MKNLPFIAIAAIAIFMTLSISCQKHGNISEKEKALKLEAPSGQLIAANIQALKSEVADVIVNKFGQQQDFQIIHIEYLPVSKGFAAIITYQLANGSVYNYGSFSGVKFNALNDVLVQKGKSSQSVSPDEAGRVTITCKKTGDCECHLSVTINTDTGVITISCGCSTCDITITES